MLRAFAILLLIFWLVGLLAHLDGAIHLLGIAAVALFTISLVRESSTDNARKPSIRPLPPFKQ
jgi:hypothetical protein